MQPSSPASVFEAGSASLIRLAVESLTSDPSLTPEQARTRGEAVVCAIMAFLPSEPVQTMLASQAAGQHMMVLDTFRDIQRRSLSENGAIRMRMIAGTLTRTTLSLLREIRVTRAAHRSAVLEERQALRARAEWEAAQAGEAAAREAAAGAPAQPPSAAQPLPTQAAPAQSPSVQPAPVQSPRVQAAPAPVPPQSAPPLSAQSLPVRLKVAEPVQTVPLTGPVAAASARPEAQPSEARAACRGGNASAPLAQPARAKRKRMTEAVGSGVVPHRCRSAGPGRHEGGGSGGP